VSGRIAAVLLAAAALAGCGSSRAPASLGRSLVRWVRAPLVYQPPRLPHDRVLYGRVQNESRKMLALDARRLVVRDAAGRVLVSSARFTGAYAHPLYGAFQQPRFNEPYELLRLGVTTDVSPRTTSPLWVAFRERPTSRPPFTASFGGGLQIPLPVGQTL
jgi:hypothetical protein